MRQTVFSGIFFCHRPRHHDFCPHQCHFASRSVVGFFLDQNTFSSVSPGWGGARRLVDIVGRRHALELLATARSVGVDVRSKNSSSSPDGCMGGACGVDGGEKLLSMGLADRVVYFGDNEDGGGGGGRGGDNDSGQDGNSGTAAAVGSDPVMEAALDLLG